VLGLPDAVCAGRHVRRRLSIWYIVSLSLIDTVLLIGLIVMFLRARGESPRELLLGRRPVLAEAWYGVPLTFAALVLGIGILAALRVLAPSLHTVERNPLQDLMEQPGDVWLFAIVVIIAGGVREEIQRAFLLRRFEVYLGGGTVGVVVASAAFGAGHFLQGADAAIATGLLGAFWGVVYLRRRSVVAPMVSHAGFNLLQFVPFLVTQ
jgi:membrane protease YdiL (CAAX protease family)